MNVAVNDFPHRGGQVVANFSLPSFSTNFNQETGIVENELQSAFRKELAKFEDVIQEVVDATS